MNRLIFLITIFSSTLIIGSPGIEIEKLTPENSKKLGFHINLEVSDEGTSIRIFGPVVSTKNCRPRNSGTILSDDKGITLIHYSTGIANNEKPGAYGFFTDKKTVMSVYLDYICIPGEQAKSRRYLVESVADYIIQSQYIKSNTNTKESNDGNS